METKREIAPFVTTIRQPAAPAFPVEALHNTGLHYGMAASRRLNYIYVQNWKCGSSTVRSTLWAAEHEMGLASPPESPHEPSPNSPFIADRRRWELADDHFVFTIARNPFIRVLSAYLEKIHGRLDQNVWGKFLAQYRHCEHMRRCSRKSGSSTRWCLPASWTRSTAAAALRC